MATGAAPDRSNPGRSWPDRSIPIAPTGGGSGTRRQNFAVLFASLFDVFRGYQEEIKWQ
jgi:hypothetical protein